MKRAAPDSPASPGACSPEAGAMALRVLITGSTGYAPWHSKTMQDLRVKVHTWSREGTQIPRQRNDLREVIQSCTLYAQHCTAHIHILRIRRCSRSCTSMYHMMHTFTALLCIGDARHACGYVWKNESYGSSQSLRSAAKCSTKNENWWLRQKFAKTSPKRRLLSFCSRKVGRFLLPSLEKDGFLAAGVLKQLLRRDLRCSHANFCQAFRI